MTATPITRAIARAIDKHDLARDEMAEVVGQIMDGGATPAQIGGFLVALRAKGESIDELVGAATAMRARALGLAHPAPDRGIDTCGTGGDGAGTVNISTLAAILIAACGGVVAKHGNRAQSSRCGSADVLEALGVVVDADAGVVERCMARAGIGFAFAPKFHAATRHAGPVRRELGIRTIFNLLGPLTNPASVRHQVVGVYARAWCAPVAAALGALGVRRAAVVHGEGGLDEIAVRGPTDVAVWTGERVESITLTPGSFGVGDVDPAGLAGGDVDHNARAIAEILDGRAIADGEARYPAMIAAAMTAALGLELFEDRIEPRRLAARVHDVVATIANGRARDVLHAWRDASREAA